MFSATKLRVIRDPASHPKFAELEEKLVPRLLALPCLTLPRLALPCLAVMTVAVSKPERAN
jgi:hypothetical protein